MRALLKLPMIAMALAAATTQPAAAKPPVWIVHDADSTIILFGSLHLLPPGADWRPPALTDAVKTAQDLWFELPLDAAARTQVEQAALAQSRLPPGQSLSGLLSRSGRARLTRIAKRIGVPLSAIDRLQPWYAESALGVAVYRRQGALAEEGVERQIAASAPATVTLRAFETGDQQIAMFARGAQAEQVRSLEDSLKELEDDPGYVPRLVRMWMRGDVAGLDREVVGKIRKGDPEEYRRLIVDRNRAWLPLILDRLSGSGRTVMVVGVGHLVGRDGLPALLRARGVAVDGP